MAALGLVVAGVGGGGCNDSITCRSVSTLGRAIGVDCRQLAVHTDAIARRIAPLPASECLQPRDHLGIWSDCWDSLTVELPWPVDFGVDARQHLEKPKHQPRAHAEIIVVAIILPLLSDDQNW